MHSTTRPSFLSTLRFTSIGLLLLAFGFSGCKTTPHADTQKTQASAVLEGIKWELSELNGAPVRIKDEAEPAHLIFFTEDLRVAGSAGCNRVMGSYTVSKDGSLKFGPLATTMMACEDMAAEQAFLQALSQVERMEMETGSLRLLDAAGHTILRLTGTNL